MKKIKSSKLFLVASIVFLFAASFFVSQAGIGDNTKGWLWGGTEEVADETPNGNDTMLYWISMNSTGCDADGINGADDGTLEGCPPAGTAVSNYGINIPETDGPVSGSPFGHPYAWSDQYGWIDFAPGGPYPTVPVTGDDYPHGVRRLDNRLVGWARVVGIRDAAAAGNSGGWQGWIRMSSDPNDPIEYGPVINADGTIGDLTNDVTKAKTAFAWSDELGWADFSRVKIEKPAYGACGTCAGTLTQAEWDTPCILCQSGTADPATVSLPAADGGTNSWICKGVPSPANDSPTCTVTRTSCTPNDYCKYVTCIGELCDNGCGVSNVPGIKVCDPGWVEE